MVHVIILCVCLLFDVVGLILVSIDSSGGVATWLMFGNAFSVVLLILAVFKSEFVAAKYLAVGIFFWSMPVIGSVVDSNSALTAAGCALALLGTWVAFATTADWRKGKALISKGLPGFIVLGIDAVLLLAAILLWAGYGDGRNNTGNGRGRGNNGAAFFTAIARLSVSGLGVSVLGYAFHVLHIMFAFTCLFCSDKPDLAYAGFLLAWSVYEWCSSLAMAITVTGGSEIVGVGFIFTWLGLTGVVVLTLHLLAKGTFVPSSIGGGGNKSAVQPSAKKEEDNAEKA